MDERVTSAPQYTHKETGEMGRLVQTLDWSKTPLGASEHWPQSLRTAVSICLFSRFPILIFWGPELITIYNNAARPILGTNKHPDGLGQPVQETWAEIWHIVGPMLEGVYREGNATWSSDQMLPMDRHGFTEETYLTFSYSPIFDETGGIGGIFTAVTETTERVLSERRLKTLHDLGERANEGKTPEQACGIAAEVLAENRLDVPFSLIYLLVADQQQVRLVSSSGIETKIDGDVLNIHPSSTDPARWPFSEALTLGTAVQVDQVSTRIQSIVPGSWTELPHSAFVLPLAASGLDRTIGFVIVGISAQLMVDDDYRHFFELVVGHIATAIANATAYEAEHKRAEALIELDRSKTEFFSNVSHEFRTPLTLLINPLQEALINWPSLLPDQREGLEIAYRNSLRLLKLVNTLLDFSRIQSNRIYASFEPTNLAQLTADLASNFRSVVERAGLRLKIDCPPLSEPIYVDREMWEKIVLNLVSNAFKFTFEGEIAVSLRAAAHSVELEVRDTGIGIAEENLSQIFDRFHRVRGARSRSYEGSGIGLALVAELVRFHGGQIEVRSSVGVGTNFTVSVPLGTAHLPQEQIDSPRLAASTAVSAESYTEEALRWLMEDGRDETQTVPQNSGPKFATTEVISAVPQQTSRANILIADDNADMRDYLRRLLESHYSIETANDGNAALMRIEQRFPSLLIADVMMPNLDGYALLHELRSRDQTRMLPIILLSARAGEEARIEGLEAGADDYLTKPFSARELLARVDAQLKLAELRREVAETAHQAILRADRLNSLQSITGKLSQALTIEQVARTIIDESANTLSASVGSLHLLEDDNILAGIYSQGEKIEEPENQRWSRFPVNPQLIVGEVLLSRQPVWIENAAENRSRYPAMTALFDIYPGAWVVLPLLIEDHIIGILSFIFDEARPFDDEELDFMTALAQQCSQALERARLYEDEARARRDADEANALKTKFLGMVSHELRTPLASIKGFTSTLLAADVTFSPDKQRQFLSIVDEEADKLTDLVEQLLDLSRLQSGTLRIELEPQPFEAILNIATIQMQTLIAQHQFRIQVPDHLPPVLADAQRMAQVLVNLVGNAAKFSLPETTITLTVTQLQQQLQVDVSDEGIGIPASEREAVFEAFRQLDRNSLPQRGGAGLGLAICKSIVEAHGGSIWVQEQVGGTTISFTLTIDLRE